jgi:hypothetical protein
VTARRGEGRKWGWGIQVRLRLRAVRVGRMGKSRQGTAGWREKKLEGYLAKSPSGHSFRIGGSNKYFSYTYLLWNISMKEITELLGKQ